MPKADVSNRPRLARGAITAGEIIVLNDKRLSDFGTLRSAITQLEHDLYFVAFDLLHLNSHDLRDMPLVDRREILQAMNATGGSIQFSEALPGTGEAVFHLVDQADLEGMVSKPLSLRQLDCLAQDEGLCHRPIRCARR